MLISLCLLLTSWSWGFGSATTELKCSKNHCTLILRDILYSLPISKNTSPASAWEKNRCWFNYSRLGLWLEISICTSVINCDVNMNSSMIVVMRVQCSTLRFWAGCPSGNQPKCFGCLQYNFSCPDIIQMAEILLDWHMLFFFWANEESNRIGKKLGLAFFVPINFVSRIVLQKLWNKKPQRLSLTPLPTDVAQWNWILAIILHS